MTTTIDCQECGPVVHQPIPEDEAHCNVGPECECHLASCIACGGAVRPEWEWTTPQGMVCSFDCFDSLVIMGGVRL